MIRKTFLGLLLVSALGAFAAGCGDDGGGIDRPDGGPINRPDGGGGGGLNPGECFDGEPTTELEIINACPTTGCIPFDNATRIPPDKLALVPQ
ncbi:MAG: hypothetical protein GXY23_11700 [Myxococcales bacterium]|nr:hypothetical protein [Myxococcales bacterium]